MDKGFRHDGEPWGGAARVDGDDFTWPLLTLDGAALEHNVGTVARAFAAAGVEHAPHVKTHMSPEIFERQLAAGAWGATVATVAQLGTVVGWDDPWDLADGGRRALLANQLVDPRDVAWLRRTLEARPDVEVWVYVDSPDGLATLARGFDGATVDAVSRLGVLVELGTPGGRTGLRDVAGAVTLGRAVAGARLRLVGVAGYEGPVAAGTSAPELAAVAAWCGRLREVATGLSDVVPGPVVLSAGGSAHADVVLRELAPPLGDVATRVVLRSGAYVTHDHGHYRRSDPWTRLGADALRPAITVWGQVLSVPEDGLVVCGVGKRDVSSDLGLPTPLWVRRAGDDGRLGPARDLAATVTALNDQHAYLAVGPGHGIAPGDVVGLGISHPCTTLDRWRRAAVVDGDVVTQVVRFDF